MQAISELSDLNLSLDNLPLRAVALCASVCDVDLGNLVALHGNRAFIFPAWHSTRAERLVALVSLGLRRSECQDLWSAAHSGGRPGLCQRLRRSAWHSPGHVTGQNQGADVSRRGSAAGCSL